MRVLGISGSLRRDSHNVKLLRAAGEIFKKRGLEFEVYGDLKAVPPYDEDDDLEMGPGAVEDLRSAVLAADAVFFSTPEYNHSIPGQLKNAVDWLSRPVGDGALKGKTVGVVGASTGLFGAVWAQAELRKVLAAAGAQVVEEELPLGHAHARFDEDGRLNEQDVFERLARLVNRVVEQLAQAHERVAA